MKPDLVAPGNKVISVCAPRAALLRPGVRGQHGRRAGMSSLLQIPSSVTCRRGTTSVLSGTSMAAPVVAGAAALLLQASPSLSPDTVKARLMISADKWVSPAGASDPCTYGAGYLNIPAALKNTAVAAQPTLSPTLTEDSKGNVSINAAGLLSASHIIWGTSLTDLHIIWGPTPFPAPALWPPRTSSGAPASSPTPPPGHSAPVLRTCPPLPSTAKGPPSRASSPMPAPSGARMSRLRSPCPPSASPSLCGRAGGGLFCRHARPH